MIDVRRRAGSRVDVGADEVGRIWLDPELGGSR